MVIHLTRREWIGGIILRATRIHVCIITGAILFFWRWGGHDRMGRKYMFCTTCGSLEESLAPSMTTRNLECIEVPSRNWSMRDIFWHFKMKKEK